MTKPNILVIKHGALGDIVIATAAMSAIRAHHLDAHITLLTTKPYAELLAQSPYFNEIWVDSRPKLFDRKALGRLKTMLNSKRWEWVYDLQTSQRSTLYPWLIARPWPNISNASRWTSHGFTGPERLMMHSYTHDIEQLARAGITIGMPDISWLDGNISSFVDMIGSHRSVPQGEQMNAFALLVPGGAAHRPEKRWPAEQYASLAQEISSKAIRPVLIGTQAEAEALDSIAARVPSAINLCGKTSIAQLATLARHAQCAIGNDTGPMHVIAASGCPSTVLFSHASDPARSAPVGPQVACLRERDLSMLTVDRALTSIAQKSSHAHGN